jgi:hypothetical protein
MSEVPKDESNQEAIYVIIGVLSDILGELKRLANTHEKLLDEIQYISEMLFEESDT